MTPVLSLAIAGDAQACRTTAHALLDLMRRCETVVARVDASRVPRDCWAGEAASRWAVQRRALRASATAEVARLDGFARGLSDFAAILDGTRARLAAIRMRAVRLGILVVGDVMHAPQHGASALAEWPAIVREVGDERAGVEAAHRSLASVLAQARGDGLLDGLGSAVLRLPPVDGDRWEVTAWAIGLPGTVVSLPTERFKANLSLVATAATRSTDDTVRRVATARESAAPAGKQALKELGVAGNVLTVGLDVREQWQADADAKGMDDRERVARAVVRGVVEGTCTIGGAAAGAAALGWIPGGAFVGGAAGGWAGEKIGGWAADHAVDRVDDTLALIDTATASVADAADAIGDAAAETAEGVRDVADRLCFWD